MKSEKDETPKDEMKETPSKQKEEAESGTEEHGSVKIPEAFQVQATALVNSCEDKACLDFLHSCVYARENELRKAEEAKLSKGKKSPKIPSEYSTESMPSM